MNNFSKNLLPKLSLYSRISNSIRYEMEHITKNPKTIPSIIGGKYNYNVNMEQFSYIDKIASYRHTPSIEILEGLNNFEDSKEEWNKMNLKDRLQIFLDAADLIENKYYDKMIAYTILGQNKTPHEAEIDAICELVDFLRFNVNYVYQLHNKQPLTNIYEDYRSETNIVKNSSRYLPLNGFVGAITPFNFTAIGGNLALTPLMLGNCVFWKPSDSSILSNYLIYEIMKEAGLPEGILNFTPSDPHSFSNTIINHQKLGGLLFTGSSQVFDNIYEKVSSNIHNYDSYVRLVGETGGKNFHFVHHSYHDDIQYLVDKTFESAFSYSGQKCSACSRLYLPENMLDEFIALMKHKIKEYMSYHKDNYGLINNVSYAKMTHIMKEIKTDPYSKVLIGGNLKEENYFMEPTVVTSTYHNNILFSQEFFAPLLAVYTYKPEDTNQVVELCSTSSKYALTGAVFSKDTDFIDYFSDKLKYKCGNFYINDKSTGSVVGQQPFGGSGKSGTNDKAGDINFIYRLTNQQNIKECIR